METEQRQGLTFNGPEEGPKHTWRSLLNHWMDFMAHSAETAAKQLAKGRTTVEAWRRGSFIPNITDAEDLAERMGCEAITVRRAIQESRKERKATEA